MAEGDNLIELKFRIYDGTDIVHGTYAPTTPIVVLKQRIIAEWPQGKSCVPKSVNDMKVIHAGKVLDNGKTLGDCNVHVGGLPGGVITMHVVVQPPLTKLKSDKKLDDGKKINKCSCTIM